MTFFNRFFKKKDTEEEAAEQSARDYEAENDSEIRIVGNAFDQEGMGALPNTYDNRDIPAGAVLDTVARPKKYITDMTAFGVEDQRSHGSCVGQAEGKKIEHFEFLELGKVTHVSKRFIYTECKKRDGIPESEGTYPRVAAKVLMDIGAAKEEYVEDDNRLPYDEYLHPEVSAAAYKDAEHRKVKGYAFVNALMQEELLQSIYQQQVIPASIIVGDTSKLPIKPTPARGSHRIVLIGYEEVETKKDKGRVKIYFLNSWGERWGDDGIGWLWLDEYIGMIYDIMIYTDLPNGMIEDVKSQPFLFTRTLKLDMEGEDVKKLQERLNQDPDTKVADSGWGSPGKETTYFGELTRSAVKRYQCKHGIVCSGDEQSTGYGQVGPATRRSLNAEEDKGLYPIVAMKRDQLIEICQMAGFPIVVTDEYRTFAEQDALYAKGRTIQGPIVTNAKGGESLHNWRCAFDVAFKSGNGISYDGPWEKVGRIGEIIGMEWGGRWTSPVDKPHFQFTNGYTLDDFQQGRVDDKKFDI